MIKIIAMLVTASIAMCVMLTGCSKGEDIQHGRKENVKVIMELPNGEVIEGCPDWWARIDNYVKVTINGVEYTTHLENVVIIEVKE
jgi:hypothetical protein